ncbi:MAG: sodium/solute symporter [Pseudobdellovibrionaceae bacterium]|nr:sodium:solute symporter [Bdellovibrionales bacterium]USN47688.1 MAG: sodium/solute symporter [Pseudobdellovibrionaceae bacterium]
MSAQFEISNIDLVLLFLYFVVVLAIGWHFAKRHSGSEDYFLAGRKLGWATIGFSLFASNISSTTLVGLSGAAYSSGISISNYEWMASVVLVIFAVFFVPYYVGSRIYTMPEFLERRYGPALRYYFSLLTVVGNLFIDTAGTLFAGALVIQFFFPSVEVWQSALILAIVAGLYTAAGGLSAVVYTDVIQAVTLLVGTTVLTFLALDRVGSWQYVVENTPPEMLSVIRPNSDPTMPWLGLVTGVPILGFYFWCTNQFIVQRVLGARNIHHARWGALFGGLLKLPVLFIMVFPGVMARFIFPDLERPDLVFPTMVHELLPVGVRGLVLAGLVAAIMSSIDSTLHSASTLVTMDFVKRWRPQWGQERLTVAGRFITAAFMLIAAFWTPMVARFETLFEYLQSSLAYLFPPVVAVFVMGLFWSRTSSRAALTGMVLTHGVAVAVFLDQNFFHFLPQVHFLLLGGSFFLLACLVMFGLSFVTPPPEPSQIKNYVWSKERVAELEAGLPKVSWYQDYRIHSAILLVLTTLLVGIYW